MPLKLRAEGESGSIRIDDALTADELQTLVYGLRHMIEDAQACMDRWLKGEKPDLEVMYEYFGNYYHISNELCDSPIDFHEWLEQLERRIDHTFQMGEFFEERDK